MNKQPELENLSQLVEVDVRTAYIYMYASNLNSDLSDISKVLEVDDIFIFWMAI